ncbi:MAG: hypothetical protein L0229_27230 [Blastocatellia bacterium]|nr:hypothetical protein [Blastocatellia bacterium]
MSFKIQMPVFLNEPVKGARGLALGNLTGVRIQDALLVASIAAFSGEPLDPGKEVSVSLPVSNLPPNASVKRVRATIEIGEDASAQKAGLKQASTVTEGNTTKNFSVDIEAPASPRNISVRLDGGEVFWSFAEIAVQGAHELPDFAEQVNAYLDELPSGVEEVSLKFLVKSDGPGRVRITINDIDYSVIQTQSWPNPLDDTIRLDRTFQMDFGSIERVPLKGLAGNTGVSLSEIKLDIGGEFGPERLLTNIEAHDGKEFATISSDYSLAQSFKLKLSLEEAEKPIRATGITGVFQSDQEAELYFAIQNDANGSPSADKPLAGSRLTFTPDEGTGRWVFAGFDSPVELKLEALYWIIIKGIRGKVQAGIQAQVEQYLDRAIINRGGQLWKSFGSGAAGAMLRVVYLPEIDNQSAAIEIGIEGTSAFQRLDPQAQAQTISFDVPPGAGDKEAVLLIKSHARGTLSIANVIQEYSPGGTRSLFKLQADSSTAK